MIAAASVGDVYSPIAKENAGKGRVTLDLKSLDLRVGHLASRHRSLSRCERFGSPNWRRQPRLDQLLHARADVATLIDLRQATSLFCFCLDNLLADALDHSGLI